METKSNVIILTGNFDSTTDWEILDPKNTILFVDCKITRYYK